MRYPAPLSSSALRSAVPVNISTSSVCFVIDSSLRGGENSKGHAGEARMSRGLCRPFGADPHSPNPLSLPASPPPPGERAGVMRANAGPRQSLLRGPPLAKISSMSRSSVLFVALLTAARRLLGRRPSIRRRPRRPRRPDRGGPRPGPERQPRGDPAAAAARAPGSGEGDHRPLRARLPGGGVHHLAGRAAERLQPQRDARSRRAPARASSGTAGPRRHQLPRHRRRRRVKVTLADQSTWDAAARSACAPDKDLAVLKIDAPARKLPPLPLGNSETCRSARGSSPSATPSASTRR